MKKNIVAEFVLTKEQYEDILSKLIKKEEGHWICQSWLSIDGTKCSPSTIGRLIYKYMFSDFDFTDKQRWRKCDWCSRNLHNGACVNPEHNEYVLKDEFYSRQRQRDKENREREKEEAKQRYAEGYRKCQMCDKIFLQQEKYRNNRLITNMCDLYCWLLNFTDTDWTSVPKSDVDCNISRCQPIKEFTAMGCGFDGDEQTLHALAISAKKIDVADHLGEWAVDAYDVDPDLIGCPKNDQCINPLHYVITTVEEKAKAEMRNVQLNIIERIPSVYREHFKRWYRNHLFAQMSDAFVKDENEKAEEILIKLVELVGL